MRFRARAAVALTLTLTLALVAAACGGEASIVSPRASSPAPDPSGTTPTPPAVGGAPEILEFEAPLLGGGTLRGVDLAGKDVAFWFWAPW